MEINQRLTISQAAKYVPLAGQAISALIGYAAIFAVPAIAAVLMFLL